MKIFRSIIMIILVSVCMAAMGHLPSVVRAEEAFENETMGEPIDPEPIDQGVLPQAAASSGETTDEPGSGLKVSLPEAMQFTGASTYRYPIEVPPGRAGLAPQIALTYNSQTRNGWLGVGWSLDMGSIQRNTKYGLSYTNNDQPGAFVASINGSSADLVPRTSDWGTGMWSARVEGSFSKYYFNVQSNYWIVTSKDGTKYYYGYRPEANSRQDFSSGTFKWLLDKVEDVNGNFMTLSYTKDTDYGNNEVYLTRIDYTGNSNSPNLGATNYVEFTRDNGTTRQDAPNMYTTNYPVQTRYRLSTITTSANGQPVRTYTIAYGTSPDISRSRISSITQSSGSSTLPSTSFTYHGTNDAFGQATWASQTDYRTNAFNWVCDVDGDGKQDIVTWNNSTSITINFAGNNGFDTRVWSGTFKQYNGKPMIWVGDFNGDGMTDIISRDDSDFCTMQYSTGSFFDRKYNWPCDLTINVDYGPQYLFGDFNGDGKMDITTRKNATQATVHRYSDYHPTDVMETAANGIGGTSILAYLPSSERSDAQNLPFVVPTVDRITVNAGNGVTTFTDYDYQGGLYTHADREFYGFDYAKLTNPVGTTTETWFKQREADGVHNRFKGLPERQITKNNSGATFIDAAMTYAETTPATGVAFPYLEQKDAFIYDGYPTLRHARTFLRYDGYGNITDKETAEVIDDQGNTQDKRNEYTEYSNDTTNWVFNRPVHTWITNTDKEGPKKAESWFAYDGRWNLLSKTARLAGGTNPTVSYTYNQYGNQVTATDARNYTTTMEYDATETYVVRTTNPKNHVVDATWDPKYGKLLTKTIPHLSSDPGPYPQTVNTYDGFGRLSTVTPPGYTTPSQQYQYLNFGTVGQQRVTILLAFNLWKETFFDGLGRTIYTRKSSANPASPILTTTEYNTIGQTARQSTPCFADEDNLVCLGTTYWTTFAYDAIGRVSQTTFPDTTTSQAIYNQGETTLVNANGRVKIKEKDIHGQLVRVVEHTGFYPNHVPYATTQYTYDTLGNLTDVVDAHGNHTIIAYDTLSRKTTMQDPDMGTWYYGYDAAGNLTSQTDAKNHTITFTYDEIGRVTLKNYNDPPVTNIVYTYDEPSAPYPVGRLTTVTDGSGNARFSYDAKGRTTQTIKTIGTTPYTTSTAYDILDRTTSITYPNTTVVNYAYDTGGNLLEVSSGSTVFAHYSNYTATGQVGEILYGNLVQTTYQYNPATSRLATLNTTGSTTLQNLSYGYDNVGNVTAIDDSLDHNRDQDFTYDHLNRLTQAQSPVYGTLTYQYNEIGNMTQNSQVGTYAYPAPGSARPHAMNQAGTHAFTYDANGNMTADTGAARTLNWTYDNKPSSITSGGTTTTFTYDYSGKRVKKIASQTTVYPSSLYKCTGSTCTAYIFGNGKRIAKVTGSTTLYIHGDHLGSAAIMTNQSGTKVRETYYYPYGQTRTTSGTQDDKYKFTDQEQDTETGLYNFNARHYDPILGRFVSPDSIVQNYEDPQTLNRYSYCGNNPILYVDPSGNLFFIDDLTIGALLIGMAKGAAIGAAVGATVSAVTGGDIGKGALTGAISGAIFGGAGTIIQTGGLEGVVAAKAAIHSAAGAISSGINASITGSNIGIEMGIGAVSAGMGSFAGNYLPKDLLIQTGARSLIGGISGGLAAELYGGTFGAGFQSGAVTAGIGALANEGHNVIFDQAGKWWSNTAMPWLKSTFGGVYGDANIMAGLGGTGILVNTEGKMYRYWCGGLAGGVSTTVGGSGFTPGEWFAAFQVSAVGPVTPTVQGGWGSQSGFFSESGVSYGWAWGFTVCRINKDPVNP